MQALDSRASRMSPNQALLTLHADYIGGQHANYRKWYFAAHLNLDDAVGQSQNPGLQRLKSVKGAVKTPGSKHLDSALNRWRNAMNNMSQYDRLCQIALYLLCWGEAGNVRFVPECLCFIFKCADDYYRSPECQNSIEPVQEGLAMKLWRVNLFGERDHDEIIGYDDINQLFWYPEGLARIVLENNTRLVDISPPKRFMNLRRVDWNRVFFKTYFEKRSTAHLLVNFNRVWILHTAVYWFYTAFNSPRVYAPPNKLFPAPAMAWSATAWGGAVATFIMIFATIAEFMYIPTTWNNASHLTTRLIFLLVILALTGGPTVYIAYVESRPNPTNSQIPLIVGIVQFFISVVATITFGLFPSGRMFGDRVAGISRKYMASQTFTASYPDLTRSARSASILLWLLFSHRCYGANTQSRVLLPRNAPYMESEWWAFSELWKEDMVYRGQRVMPFSTGCTTPLSNFEAGSDYREVSDPAITVAFTLVDDPDTALLAWTTTPWTLPSNLGLCVHPDFTHSLGTLYKDPKKAKFKKLASFKGSDMKGWRFVPLFEYFTEQFEDRAFRVVTDTYVTATDGTGIVQQAPAFGEDDHRIAVANGIVGETEMPPCPLDDSGKFTKPVTDFEGMYIKAADKEIQKVLKAKGRLIVQSIIKHSYPTLSEHSGKHFLNTAPSLVVDSLEGLCAANPQLALDAGNKVLYLASPDRSKVALVCGGGSGREC
ncbi:tRNA synthetases class I-domain-containing protein [Hygrophoropsis aurantiaca]|uniref:tRNA synthetases class I-domain-containing protein n=1 Tax=Hygrophoropsis aurantiaca TaxID=72124 RepID=A0ACB7ZS50_9AGAM|nr:tRNA synthetases class I-domain-containing protein [Hygrophoropsis aurantiaca]